MNKCFVRDCRGVMKDLIVQGVKVQMCVTSPPYWGLRDYGHPDQFGLEKTPEEYTANMVKVFGLVRELLADDGTLWLNLGDSYAGSGGAHKEHHANPGISNSFKRNGVPHWGDLGQPSNYLAPKGLKSKDLVGIPWRVAFALQADGWWLRQDIVWSKGNPMPESVQDRFCKSHEYLFLLSKSERYFFDLNTVLEPCESGPSDLRKMMESKERIGGKHKVLIDPFSKASSTTNIGQKRSVGGIRVHGNIPGRDDEGRACNKAGQLMRTPRSVWHVNTEPFRGAHFAVMPSALVTRCILAGSRPGDIVLDPFFGSGTTGQVAEALGRKWIGIELNEKYRPLWEERTRQMGLSI